MSKNRTSKHISQVESRIREFFGRLDKGDQETIAQNVSDFTLATIESISGWYRRKKDVKKFFSRTIYAITALTILAGLTCGILGEIRGFNILPYGYIFFGAAGLLQLLDRWFAFSGDWHRFMLASLKLEKLLSGFALSWQAIDASGGQTAQRVELARATVDSAYEIMLAETHEWIRATLSRRMRTTDIT